MGNAIRRYTEDNLDTTGKRIRAARLALGMSQNDLKLAVERAGGQVDVSMISYMENDERTPSVAMLLALCKALQIDDTDYLLDPMRIK